MKRGRLALVVAIAASPATANAFSYSWVKPAVITGYAESNSEYVDDLDYSGGGVELAIDLKNKFALYAQLASVYGETTGYDGWGAYDIEYSVVNTQVGAFYYHPLTPSLDIQAGAGFIQQSSELKIDGYSAGDDSDSGNALWLGIRSMVADKVELGGRYATVSMSDTSYSQYSISGQFYPNQRMSFGASLVRDTDGAEQQMYFTGAFHF